MLGGGGKEGQKMQCLFEKGVFIDVLNFTCNEIFSQCPFSFHTVRGLRPFRHNPSPQTVLAGRNYTNRMHLLVIVQTKVRGKPESFQSCLWELSRVFQHC